MVSMYYIKIEDLGSIRERDPIVDSKINQIEESMVYRDNAVAIDYIISNPKKQKRDTRPVKLIERRNELTHVLKNAVMFYIGKNREKRKKPNLSDILFAAVEKKKREMQAARKKKANFDSMDLKGNYLTEDEFDIVGELIQKQISAKMNTELIETLQKKFEYLLADIEKMKNPDVIKQAQEKKKRDKYKLSMALSSDKNIGSFQKSFDEKSKFGDSSHDFKPM